MNDTQWALTEPVDVTAVGPTSALFTRVTEPGAFVLTATEDGELLINGVSRTLDEATVEALTNMADFLLVGEPRYGFTIRMVEVYEVRS